MGRLHIFDMDGTLLRGSSAGIQIAREMGLVAEFQELGGGAAARGDRPCSATRNARYAMWSTLTEHQVSAAFEGSPWLTGIREVWADITAQR